MPANNDETPTTKTLRERTQTFRDKATRLLRMEKINQVLQMIFGFNRNISRLEKDVENLTKEETNAEKIVTRAEYKMSKLDENDPDYEEKKEKAVEFIKTEEKRQETVLEDINNEIKRMNKNIETSKKSIENLDEKIEAIESGESKVSIDEVNDLADSLIKKS